MANSNKKSTPLIKKSYSLRFDEVDCNNEKSELKKLKHKDRNSLDNISNSLIEELNESGEYSMKTPSGAFSFLKSSPFKIYQDKDTPRHAQKGVVHYANAEVQCNADEEFTIKESDLTEEELDIKAKNPGNYWKLIAEKLRVELYDHLSENMELHKLKEELKDEHQELLDERDRLMKLINDADDLFNEIQRTSTNDSGIQ